jgi:CHAD domain-containing protein
LSYSFRLSDHSLTDGVRRIARSQIETAIAEIDDKTLGPVTTVHQLRKRCKKVRGLVRLVRPGFKAYRQENAAFRDLSRSLADLRDAGALLETVATLEARFGGIIGGTLFSDVREALAAASPPADDAHVAERLAGARGAFEAALIRTEGWKVKGKAPDILARGVVQTCKRAVKTLEQAEDDGTPVEFHEFRKRVKYHWYHMRLMKHVWPKMIHARIVEARHLATSLGDLHDLAVFRLTVLPLVTQADARLGEALGGLIEAEEKRLAPACLHHGHRLFAEKPRPFGDGIGAYWSTWQETARV